MAEMGLTTRAATAAGVAAGTGAAQLGLGYGLGVVAWPVSATADDSVLLGSLGWATWITASATVFGAVLAGRARGGPAGRYTAALRLVLAISAAIGAIAAVALIALPARSAVRVESFPPGTVAAAYALLGVALGLVVAFWAVVSRPVAANLIATGVWLWTLAIAAVVVDLTLQRPSATYLTSLQFAGHPALLGPLDWPSALLTLAAAFVLGAATAIPAARRGNLALGTAASGTAGPLLVAAAFLALSPRLNGTPGPIASAYLIAPYAVLSGMAGSALVVATCRAIADRRPTSRHSAHDSHGSSGTHGRSGPDWDTYGQNSTHGTAFTGTSRPGYGIDPANADDEVPRRLSTATSTATGSSKPASDEEFGGRRSGSAGSGSAGSGSAGSGSAGSGSAGSGSAGSAASRSTSSPSGSPRTGGTQYGSASSRNAEDSGAGPGSAGTGNSGSAESGLGGAGSGSQSGRTGIIGRALGFRRGRTSRRASAHDAATTGDEAGDDTDGGTSRGMSKPATGSDSVSEDSPTAPRNPSGSKPSTRTGTSEPERAAPSSDSASRSPGEPATSGPASGPGDEAARKRGEFGRFRRPKNDDVSDATGPDDPEPSTADLSSTGDRPATDPQRPSAVPASGNAPAVPPPTGPDARATSVTPRQAGKPQQVTPTGTSAQPATPAKAANQAKTPTPAQSQAPARTPTPVKPVTPPSTPTPANGEIAPKTPPATPAARTPRKQAPKARPRPPAGRSGGEQPDGAGDAEIAAAARPSANRAKKAAPVPKKPPTVTPPPPDPSVVQINPRPPQ